MAATERLTTVTVTFGGGEQTILTLDAADGLYTVGGAHISWHGGHGRVGGVHQKSFTDLAAARKYANGWYFKLVGKGARRTSNA